MAFKGDEPGGFLSADLYIDLALKTGNLIVVPRANFNSIISFQRGSNGDMNRKFGGQNQDDYDSQIVRILEQLMSESDILLNLHDGWGFYRPTYESEQANPRRYGQSIIADSESFTSEKTGQTLALKNLALKAIQEINSQIENLTISFSFHEHPGPGTRTLHTRNSVLPPPLCPDQTVHSAFAWKHLKSAGH